LAKDKSAYQKAKPFNLLSISSSGINLWDELLAHLPNMFRDTDLVVGSAVGGIQALCIAAGKSPYPLPENVADLFGGTRIGDLDKHVVIFTNFGMYQNFTDSTTHNTPVRDIIKELMDEPKELVANPALLGLGQALNPDEFSTDFKRISLFSAGYSGVEGPDWVHYLCCHILNKKYLRFVESDVESAAEWLKTNWK